MSMSASVSLSKNLCKVFIRIDATAFTRWSALKHNNLGAVDSVQDDITSKHETNTRWYISQRQLATQSASRHNMGGQL